MFHPVRLDARGIREFLKNKKHKIRVHERLFWEWGWADKGWHGDFSFHYMSFIWCSNVTQKMSLLRYMKEKANRPSVLKRNWTQGYNTKTLLALFFNLCIWYKTRDKGILEFLFDYFTLLDKSAANLKLVEFKSKWLEISYNINRNSLSWQFELDFDKIFLW